MRPLRSLSVLLLAALACGDADPTQPEAASEDPGPAGSEAATLTASEAEAVAATEHDLADRLLPALGLSAATEADLAAVATEEHAADVAAARLALETIEGLRAGRIELVPPEGTGATTE